MRAIALFSSSGSSVDMPEWKNMKILRGASLNFCQFSSQPSQVQKAVRYFPKVPAHEFAAIPAACATISIPECVPNDRFGGAKDLSYLAISQAVCDHEHRLELHWRQEIC
jgi:hypothetical protein